MRDLKSLELVQTRGSLRLLALIMALLFCGLVAALVYVPWQQAVVGKGQVTAFSPSLRPQSVQAPIPGRIVKWHAREGQAVRKGQLLLVLDDLESRFLDPRQPALLRQQMLALKERRAAVAQRLVALEGQASSLGSSQEAAVPAARQRILQARERAAMARQGVVAAAGTWQTARLNQERLRKLHEKGLRSTRDLEVAQLELVRARTELERARAAREVADRDVQTAGLDAQKVQADTSASIGSVLASTQQAREAMAAIDADLLKLQAELNNLERRTEQRKVFAPVAGTLVRIEKVGAGETVKSGDDLAVLVPQAQDAAVELMVSGFDAPLIEPGRPVRLVFDGFPAVPFTAWPWAAVGTFGGRVALVDAVDDGTGKYRVLVRPDLAPGDVTWPPSNRLRPGTRATGFVMLDNVPLYYEVWRRLNAFPPTVTPEEKGTEGKKSDEKKTKPVLKK